jgi:hypothetical protein
MHTRIRTAILKLMAIAKRDTVDRYFGIFMNIICRENLRCVLSKKCDLSKYLFLHHL